MSGKAQRLPSTFGSASAASSPVQRWRALLGTEPPQSAALVEQAIAWREQVLAEGDVSAVVRRDLALAAAQARTARVGAGGVVVPAVAAPQHCSAATLPPASSQLQPGARLVKSYGGVTYVVEVTTGGTLYAGKLYASLSAVAKAITGTHWNGLLFFGLRRRGVYPKKVAAHG